MTISTNNFWIKALDKVALNSSTAHPETNFHARVIATILPSCTLNLNFIRISILKKGRAANMRGIEGITIPKK